MMDDLHDERDVVPGTLHFRDRDIGAGSTGQDRDMCGSKGSRVDGLCIDGYEKGGFLVLVAMKTDWVERAFSMQFVCGLNRCVAELEGFESATSLLHRHTVRPPFGRFLRDPGRRRDAC